MFCAQRSASLAGGVHEIIAALHNDGFPTRVLAPRSDEGLVQGAPITKD